MPNGVFLETRKVKVAVAGGTGFVGMALIQKLALRYDVVGLGRNLPKKSIEGVEWKKTDFLSLIDAEEALKDVEIAYYLIHSMMPSARLSQGRFQDFDLIAADNFARSAHKTKVKQIIYLGGLIPEDDELSDHLQSRLEVEHALTAYGTPVTILRASMVVGPSGSSFVIMKKLVERLPVMLCPEWTRKQTQPIALKDVVQLLAFCANNKEVFGDTFDIGGPDVLTYEEMMRTTAQAMGKNLRIFHFSGFTIGLSRLWVSLITGAPKSLVLPLIQSLRHRMVARENRLVEMAGIKPLRFEVFLRETLGAEKKLGKNQKPIAFLGNRRGEEILDVSSIQRFALPGYLDATWIAQEYLKWLPKRFIYFIRVKSNAESCAFFLWPFRKPLLVLVYSKERSTKNRALFYVKGGFLAQIEGRGRLEMREVLNRRFLLISLLEFRPKLPWFFYKATQARLHLWVMKSFGRYLRRRHEV